MKSLFDSEAYSEIKNRLSNLSETSKSQWGKMNIGQMAHHCQGPLNIVLGKNDYGFKPNWFLKLFKKSLYSDKPFKKNLPTAKPFRVIEEKNFNAEKIKLEELLSEFNNQRDRAEWGAHPIFGALTKEQWGKAQYKHLDHHFKQFGA